MPFRFDRRHLTGQQQAIASQRDRADEEAKKRAAAAKVEALEKRIIELLTSENRAMSVQEIAKGLDDEKNEVGVLQSLNGLTPKKVELLVTPLDGDTSVRYKAVISE